MIQFSTIIKQFRDQGEKTGWTYIEIPASIAEQLKRDNKRTFRVKGKLDNYSFEGLALFPMGEGDFILALNATIRKKIGKRKGAMVLVKIEEDKTPAGLNSELMECLVDEPEGLAFFNSLTPGHRRYFSVWISSAKTDATKTKRIAQTINALSNHQGFGQMLRALINDRKNKIS